MQIGYAISSHVSYVDVAVPRLVNSLLSAGVEPEDIDVVIGGEERSARLGPTSNYDILPDYTAVYVPYNSFEYNALIETANRPKGGELTHIFLLHDTCEVTPDFPRIVKEGAVEWADITSFNGCICNFGLYRVDFLQRPDVKSFLNSLKNCSKLDAINFEGYLYRAGIGKNAEYACADVTVEDGYRDVYGTGTPRLVEHYMNGSLIKYKANHGQTYPGTYVTKV